MKNTHTHKGHCQACGRIQAVDNSTKLIAKHGYRVAGFGFFMGTCQGSDKKALELDKSFSEDMIVKLAEYRDEQINRARNLLDGKEFPSTVYSDNYIRARYVGRTKVPGTGCYEEVPFAQGNEEQKNRAIREAVNGCKSQAVNAEYHREFLAQLIQTIHGIALQVNKDLTKKEIAVGSTVLVRGVPHVVTKIEGKVASGIGPSLNGRYVDHVFYMVDGKERAYPKRFARLVEG